MKKVVTVTSVVKELIEKCSEQSLKPTEYLFPSLESDKQIEQSNNLPLFGGLTMYMGMLPILVLDLYPKRELSHEPFRFNRKRFMQRSYKRKKKLVNRLKKSGQCRLSKTYKASKTL